MEYRKGSHSVYDIKYHVVWVTKYRHKVLSGQVALRLRELIRQSCESRGVVIVRGNISKEHVHMLLSCPPVYAPAKIVQYLKGRSSRMLQDEFVELKRRYWGQHLWARGYFCGTVGAVTEEMIKQYVENQSGEEEERQFRIVDDLR
jgi:putative transposase